MLTKNGNKLIVALTGASGAMGSEAVKQILPNKQVLLRILLRPKKSNIKYAKQLKRKYNDNIEILFGDLKNKEDCQKLIDNATYVFHCAAMIPPQSDHFPVAAKKSNYDSLVNLVSAIKESKRADEIYFVHTATVALYGNRNYKHMWARVGDPLLPSSYDYYASYKMLAERYLLEAGLPHFVSLRQTAILHKNMFKNNMADGLMFHTSWNAPLEWVTDVDSGRLLSNLLKKSMNDLLDKKFWNNVYNIGGGDGGRCIGYETLNDGFKIMGRTAKDFFKPNWNAYRNFHGVWYSDSHVLNDYLDFVRENNKIYWKRMAQKNWYFKFGKIVPPKMLSKLVIQKLFKNTNAPKYWVDHNFEGRIDAFYGSKQKFDQIGEDWSKFPLLCENKCETGDIDYAKLKDETKLKQSDLLNHGYDETKKDSELDISDMQKVAEYRGGKCLSKTMKKGDLWTKLEWQCSEGHKFFASPFTIAKAGHWCPECFAGEKWNFDYLATKTPFYAQVWYDSHDKSERDRVYPYNSVEVDTLSEE